MNGRFTRADDRGYSNPYDPQSLNLYAYAYNNPLRFVDPTGHTPEECPPNSSANFCTSTEAGIDWQWVSRTYLYIRSFVVVPTLPKIEIPDWCGGGGFGYGGIGGHARNVHGEILGLVEYDTTLGGAHGGLVGGGLDIPYVKHFTGGFESMRTWRDWQAHTAPIVLGGKEIPGASSFFGKNINTQSRDIGGLATYENGNLSVGIYAGTTLGSGRAFGGGGYLTVSWNGCKEK